MSRRPNSYMGSKIRQKKKYERSAWAIVLLTLLIGFNLVQFVWTALLIGEEFAIGWGKPTCIGELLWGPYITDMATVVLLVSIFLFYKLKPIYRTDEDVYKPTIVLSIVIILQEILTLVCIFW